ncbi:hypothetical protein WN943_016431 [Citrus x changshan-huyou]
MKGVQFLVASVHLVVLTSMISSSRHVMWHNIPKSTTKQVGSTVTTVNIEQIPGLSTTRHIRSSYRLRGKRRPNIPHTHPCAREILVVLEGTLYVGFVTSNQLNNTLFARALNKGDNPGVITIADAIFGSTPPIDPYAFARAFQLDPYVVKAPQAKFKAN